MAVLPTGFALPPLPYLVGLLVAVGAVGASLWRLRPAVTRETVLGLVPWMAVGSALHALYVLDLAPAAVRPLLGAPAVYATGFAGLGLAWAAAARTTSDAATVARRLALSGGAVLGAAVAAILALGSTLSLGWPAIGVAVAGALTVGAWRLLLAAVPDVSHTGAPGTVVLFAHAVDGVSTAIGVDVLGFGERTPASRVILEAAGALPTAELLGVGWLFVVVKLAVAGGVVWLFADYVQDEPRQANLLLAVVAAVGLGPGVHNLILYAVA